MLYLSKLHPVLSVPLLSIIAVCSLVLSFILTDEYLLHFLNILTKSFSLRSEIVAIFLINLGNGLPELITSILLIKESGNVKYTLYCAAGGQIFILTVVLGTTILSASKKVFLNGGSFYKNLVFILVSTLSLLIPFMTFNITRLLGLIMVFLYFSFLFYSLMTKTPGEQIEVIDETTRVSKIKKIVKRITKPVLYFFDLAICEKDGSITNEIAYFISVMINAVSFSFMSIPHLIIMRNKLALKLKRTPFSMTPVSFANVIIPVCIILVAFVILLFLLWCATRTQMPLLIYNISITVLWIFFTSQMIIDIFNVIKIDKSLIAIILLPIGNSIGDLITNSIAAHKGLVKVGLIASMTSPIHNTLLNLGLTFFLIDYNKKGTLSGIENAGKVVEFFTLRTPVDLSPQLYLIPITFSLIILFILSFNYEIRNRKLVSECGAILFTIYGLYLILVLAQALFGETKSGKLAFR